MYNTYIKPLITILLICLSTAIFSQTTQVGSGSYTNTYPGADSAGRNGFPSGVP